jgi:hypothetical protein
MHLDDDHGEGEECERLDEGQADEHEHEQAGAGSRVAGQCLSGGADGASLAEAAEAGSEAHAEADAERAPVSHRRAAALGEDRRGEAEQRQRCEQVFKFTHSSPASLEICRQWVVEAHRAGPLTLAAYRCSGAEALSGGM